MVCFRQHEDRHVSHKIKLMKWNTLMDLIAIGLKNGDVSVHRLVNWQKIWFLSWPSSTPPATTVKDNEETTKSGLEITAMEWRPDGKVLAIGYNRNVKTNVDNKEANQEKDSSIALVDIENGQVIDVIVISGTTVSCLTWQAKVDFTLNDQYKAATFTEFIEKLAPLAKSYSNNYSRKLTEDGIEDLMKVASQPSLNLMAVGTSSGQVHLYCFGMMLVGILNLSGDLSIEYISLSSDLSTMSLAIGNHQTDSNGGLLVEPSTSTSTSTPTSNKNISNVITKYELRNIHLPNFVDNSGQYFIVAHIYAKVISLLSYLEDIMGAIQETMEDILLELDSKLTSYLQQKGTKGSGSGSVILADEILELLVIGTMSDSLEKFLHQLTDKGLKKLGQSIESTYSTIQKLVVCNIQRVSKHIFSHLHVLKAIALWTNEFSQIGLKIDDINRALHRVATFYLKSLELQQVIDSSCQNLKCFFRWLYTVTCRFYNDSMSSGQQETSKISQQDLQHVADFIEENFDCQDSQQDESMSISDSSNGLIRPTATNFTLERVCQYLKPESLVYRNFSVNDQSLNPWFKYLKERPMLVNDDSNSDLLLYRHNSETSLVTEHSQLINKVSDAFKAPSNKMSELFSSTYDSCLSFAINLLAKEPLKITHISDQAKKLYYIGLIGNHEHENEVTIIKFTLDGKKTAELVNFKVTINDSGNSLETKPIDIQFYNESILSMLAVNVNCNSSFLIQLPLSTLAASFQSVSSGQCLQNLQNELSPYQIIINSSSEIAYRKLENFKPIRFDVSGSRKVTCISSKTKKRVRIFEMDGNEEETEEESEIIE